MKIILYLISSIKKDGPNRVLENMIYGIDKNRYNIIVLSFLDKNDDKCIEKLKKYGAEIIELKLTRKLDILNKGKKELKEIIQKIKPDIIHSHGVLPDIVNAKIPYGKKITTIHNNMFEDYIFTFGKSKGKLIILWHLYYLKKFDKCVCCAKSIFEVLSKKLNNCTYVRNAIYRNNYVYNYKSKRKKIRDMYDIPNDAVVYIYIGVLTCRKNILELVNEFNSNLDENEFLLIVGDGELRENAKKISCCKNIIFCGFQKNIEDFLCASDVYCSFSLSEGFSISVLEALEFDNYLLLSNIPAHKEIFEIDDKIYLGEIFKNKEEFIEKKEIVSNKIIKKFVSPSLILKKDLNCNNMVKKYEAIYEE